MIARLQAQLGNQSLAQLGLTACPAAFNHGKIIHEFSQG
jgi:hypothetical protein